MMVDFRLFKAEYSDEEISMFEQLLHSNAHLFFKVDEINFYC